MGKAMGPSRTSARTVHIGIVQLQCTNNRTNNLNQALAATAEAADQGAQIVCLPELFLSPYFCQTEAYEAFAWAEPVPGPTTKAFETLATERNLTLILSLFERCAPGLHYNTVAVLDGVRGYIGKYRKMHIPDDPRYYEKFYFAPGDLGFKTFATATANIGTLICWDQWYPEAARLTALRGADILFYPTAIGWHPEERDTLGAQQFNAWQTIQRSHAIANGCYVVAVNRTGFEPTPGATGGEGIQFWGQSFVAAPDGTVLVQAPQKEASVCVVTLPLGEIEVARLGWPFFRDRRTDAYGDMDKRFIEHD